MGNFRLVCYGITNLRFYLLYRAVILAIQILQLKRRVKNQMVSLDRTTGLAFVKDRTSDNSLFGILFALRTIVALESRLRLFLLKRMCLYLEPPRLSYLYPRLRRIFIHDFLFYAAVVVVLVQY